MPIVVYNPTNELFEATYIGERVEIASEQKIRMDDSRARHVLNVLGPRGLVQLEYGDDADDEAGVKKKAKEGRDRNREFKRHQVLRYNQMNESHKQQGLPYIPIPEQIEDYAKELGIAVLKPYDFKDKEVTEISELRQAKDDQQRYIKKLEEINQQNTETINDLKTQVQDLIATLKPQQAEAVDATQTEEARQVDLDQIRADLGFVRIPTAHFENWVARRWDDYLAAPPEIQAEIEEKWLRFYNKPFPTERPEVQNAA